MADKLRLLEFKLDTMVKHPAIVIIAKRGTGKSWITRDLMYHMRHIPCGVVISPTDGMSNFYKKFFPDLFIHYDVKPTLFENILRRQVLMIEKSKKKRKRGGRLDASSIIVMDDCLANKKLWEKDASMRIIMMNGRHHYITYILTMQYIIGIGPELRGQFDYIFLLKEDSFVVKKKLYENYASMFPTLAMFNKVLTECTKNNCSMVIDNRQPTDNLDEKVFWFKAKDRDFHFGSKSFRETHKKYYNPKHMLHRYKNLNDNILTRKRNDIDFKVDKI